MITKKNYSEHIARIGFEKLPEELKKAHLVFMTKTDNGRDWSIYEKDEGIRKVIDLAFQKLDEFIQFRAKEELKGITEAETAPVELILAPVQVEVPVQENPLEGIKPSVKKAKSPFSSIRKEVYFIQRFLDFHDKILYKKTFEVFINELQEAIRKKEISKKSPVAGEVMSMQNAVVNAYNKMKYAKHFVLTAPTIKKLKKIIEKYENAYDDIDEDYTESKKKSIGLEGINGNGRIMSSMDFTQMKFDSIGLKDKWLDLIGDPAKGFTAMVFGKPKMGKSYLCVDFAGYLARNHGKVLYVAREEKLDATLQKKLNDKEVAHPNLFVSDFLPADLSPYEFIFLDSVNKLGLSPKDIETLRVKNPGKSFVFIFQTTKEGNFRGKNEFQHDVDVVIEVPEMGKAVQFGRFNQGGEMEIFENED